MDGTKKTPLVSRQEAKKIALSNLHKKDIFLTVRRSINTNNISIIFSGGSALVQFFVISRSSYVTDPPSPQSIFS